MSLAAIIITAFGIGLIVTGLYYQLKRKQLNSAPVLITVCYVWGGANIVSCLA
jgi:hypothetical protein